LPFGQHYWSLSHKPKFVAAVIGRGRMGIDVEEIEPRKEEIFGYVASDAEWGLLGGKSWDSQGSCGEIHRRKRGQGQPSGVTSAGGGT